MQLKRLKSNTINLITTSYIFYDIITEQCIYIQNIDDGSFQYWVNIKVMWLFLCIFLIFCLPLQYETKGDEIDHLREILPAFSGDEDIIAEQEQKFEQEKQEIELKKKSGKEKNMSKSESRTKDSSDTTKNSTNHGEGIGIKKKSRRKRKYKFDNIPREYLKHIPACVSGNVCNGNGRNIDRSAPVPASKGYCQHCGGNVLYVGEICRSIDPTGTGGKLIKKTNESDVPILNNPCYDSNKKNIMQPNGDNNDRKGSKKEVLEDKLEEIVEDDQDKLPASPPPDYYKAIEVTCEVHQSFVKKSIIYLININIYMHISLI